MGDVATKEVSIRERKAAKLKLKVLSVLQQQLSYLSFSEIHVQEICKKSGISKVTFFRYFPQKEDLLLYYLRILCLDISVSLADKPLKGLKAVEFIFDKMGEAFEKYPSFMQHVIKYYAESERPPKPINVKRAEKLLLFPDREDAPKLELLSLDRMVEKYLLEAIFLKEITRTSNVDDVVRLFMTIFYGSVLVAKTKHIPFKVLLKRNLSPVFQSL